MIPENIEHWLIHSFNDKQKKISYGYRQFRSLGFVAIGYSEYVYNAGFMTNPPQNEKELYARLKQNMPETEPASTAHQFKWFFMDMQIGHIAIIRHIYDKDSREYVLGEVISDVEWWTHDMHQIPLKNTDIPLAVRRVRWLYSAPYDKLSKSDRGNVNYMSGQQTLSRIGKSANTLFGLHELWDVALQYGTALTDEPISIIPQQVEQTAPYIDSNIISDVPNGDQLVNFDNNGEIALDSNGIPLVLGDTLLTHGAQPLQYDGNAYNDLSYVNQSADTLFNPYTNQYLQQQESAEALVNALVDPTLEQNPYYPPIPPPVQPRIKSYIRDTTGTEGKRKRKSAEAFAPPSIGDATSGSLESLRLENKALRDKVAVLEQTVRELTQKLEGKEDAEGPNKKKKRSNRNAVVGQISAEIKEESDNNSTTTNTNGKRKTKKEKEKEKKEKGKEKKTEKQKEEKEKESEEKENEEKENEEEEEEEEKSEPTRRVRDRGKSRAKGRAKPVAAKKDVAKPPQPAAKPEKTPPKGRSTRNSIRASEANGFFAAAASTEDNVDGEAAQTEEEEEEVAKETQTPPEEQKSTTEDKAQDEEVIDYKPGEYVAVAPESETELYWIGKVSLVYKKTETLRVHWLERHPNFKNIFYESTGYDKIPADTILYSGFDMEQLTEGTKYNFKWPNVPVKLRPNSTTEFVPTVLWREPKELENWVQEAMENSEE